MAVYKDIIVVGGSYVGCAVASKLAGMLPEMYRVLLIEPHTHFHHLFAFPRFAAVPKHEHKGFVPYSGLFAKAPFQHHTVIRARVLAVTPYSVTLDRAWNGLTELEHSFLVLATGTTLPPPGSVSSEEKCAGVQAFQRMQSDVKAADSICIIGGGAVGVQLALDLKELYGQSKTVSLVHSRNNTMSRFHLSLHDIVRQRCEELGVDLILGSRAVVPPGGFPSVLMGEGIDVELVNGRRISANLVITATGQKPNNQMVEHLSGVVGPTGFVVVRPTLQLVPEEFGNIFAVGDIADTGAHKAARPGVFQAEVVAKNITAMTRGQKPFATYEVNPAAIHMTLGLKKNVLFINPPTDGNEPRIVLRDDGQEDMGVERQWANRNVMVTQPQDYHL
ncbi:hypothetical protein JCM24511_09480 [Saitozyma sp. JCM 24511]|nr:hypothetical protein JCM24511_09480 [Saitozyma sp. JCM 24511]